MNASSLVERIVDGRTDLVFDLVADGLPSGSKDARGVPLTKWCAYYGDVSAIRFLVAEGEALETLGPNFDLNGAAFHGHWQLCQFLIENGADVNHALADTGETPLHAALCKAMRPRFDNVVRVLLSAGANPDSPTTPGIETGAFMRDVRTRGETPLHRAAAFGTPAAVRMLLDAGANVEARDIHGETPLAWASLHLRQAAVLDMLCFGQHRIHPEAVANDRSDHGSDLGGMNEYLMGKPHTP